MQKLSVTKNKELLHSAAISKQIVKVPAIEAGVNYNLKEKQGVSFEPSAEITGEREKMPPSGFVENNAVRSIQVNTFVISSETPF